MKLFQYRLAKIPFTSHTNMGSLSPLPDTPLILNSLHNCLQLVQCSSRVHKIHLAPPRHSKLPGGSLSGHFVKPAEVLKGLLCAVKYAALQILSHIHFCLYKFDKKYTFVFNRSWANRWMLTG